MTSCLFFLIWNGVFIIWQILKCIPSISKLFCSFDYSIPSPITDFNYLSYKYKFLYLSGLFPREDSLLFFYYGKDCHGEEYQRREWEIEDTGVRGVFDVGMSLRRWEGLASSSRWKDYSKWEEKTSLYYNLREWTKDGHNTDYIRGSCQELRQFPPDCFCLSVRFDVLGFRWGRR